MRGSCLCGAVIFDVKQISGGVAHCHCGMCRKFSGTAFGTYATVHLADFTWLTGEQQVKRYRSSTSAERGFCGQCGSSLFFRLCEGSEDIEIAVGALDGDPPLYVDANIFYNSRAAWARDFERLPSYATERSES